MGYKALDDNSDWTNFHLIGKLIKRNCSIGQFPSLGASFLLQQFQPWYDFLLLLVYLDLREHFENVERLIKVGTMQKPFSLPPLMPITILKTIFNTKMPVQFRFI